MAKKANRSKNPPTEKRPRVESDPKSAVPQNIVWHVGSMDKEGPWGWDQIPSDVLWNRIHSKLICLEGMTFDEALQSNRHHGILILRLSNDAQKRLTEIGQNDIERLHSFALTGKERLWGIRDRNIFKILWWDPEHTVYPSSKRNT